MSSALAASDLPLPLWRRGKVREVYLVGEDMLLLVASDRVSAFDVVLDPPIPDKGRVLTQLAAFWFKSLAGLCPSHLITADTDEILSMVPALVLHREQIEGRATLVKRTVPVEFECVVRGFLAGSAWAEYQQSGTLAGEPLPEGLLNGSRLESPLFSPATKAQEGHDENVTFAHVSAELGEALANLLKELSLRIYSAGCDHALERGLIIADTKFEFGLDKSGAPLLIDEVLTPDSSRFWPSDKHEPGHAQQSFDKQPIRDWLDREKLAGRWNGESPAPSLPDEVVSACSERYKDAYFRITGTPLEELAK